MERHQELTNQIELLKLEKRSDFVVVKQRGAETIFGRRIFSEAKNTQQRGREIRRGGIAVPSEGDAGP